MKSWHLTATPDSAALDLRDVPVPEPKPGQLLVRLHAAALNRGELIVGHGLNKAGSSKPAGMEGAGIVEKVGAGTNGFAPGQRVMGRCAGANSSHSRHSPANPCAEACCWPGVTSTSSTSRSVQMK